MQSSMQMSYQPRPSPPSASMLMQQWDENSPVAIYSMSPPASQRGSALGLPRPPLVGSPSAAFPSAAPDETQYRRALQFSSPQFGLSSRGTSLTPPPLLREDGHGMHAAATLSEAPEVPPPLPPNCAGSAMALRPDWSALSRSPSSVTKSRQGPLGPRLDGNTLPSRLTPGKTPRESSPCPAPLPIGPPPSTGRKVQFSDQRPHGRSSAAYEGLDEEELLDWDDDGDDDAQFAAPSSPRPTKLSDIPDLPPRRPEAEFRGLGEDEFGSPTGLSAAAAQPLPPMSIGVRPTSWQSTQQTAFASSSSAGKQRRRVVPHWQGPATVAVDDVLDRFATKEAVDRSLFEHEQHQHSKHSELNGSTTIVDMGPAEDWPPSTAVASVPRNRTAGWKKRVVGVAAVATIAAGACVGGLVAAGIIA